MWGSVGVSTAKSGTFNHRQKRTKPLMGQEATASMHGVSTRSEKGIFDVLCVAGMHTPVSRLASESGKKSTITGGEQSLALHLR